VLPLRTLDDIVASTTQRWNVVKIDCEGYDVHVVLGAKRLLHEHRPILWGEFHGPLTPRYGAGFSALDDLLRSAKYTVFVFDAVYVIRRVEIADGVGNCALVPDELVSALESELERRRQTSS
jgi:hypothetical protein